MSDSDFFAPSGGGGVGTSTILAGTGITVTTAGAGKVTIADQELWHLLQTNGLPFYFVSQTDPGADYTTMTAADLAVGAAQPNGALIIVDPNYSSSAETLQNSPIWWWCGKVGKKGDQFSTYTTSILTISNGLGSHGAYNAGTTYAIGNVVNDPSVAGAGQQYYAKAASTGQSLSNATYWTAITVWSNSTAYVVGNVVQTGSAVGNPSQNAWICIQNNTGQSPPNSGSTAYWQILTDTLGSHVEKLCIQGGAFAQLKVDATQGTYKNITDIDLYNNSWGLTNNLESWLFITGSGTQQYMQGFDCYGVAIHDNYADGPGAIHITGPGICGAINFDQHSGYASEGSIQSGQVATMLGVDGQASLGTSFVFEGDIVPFANGSQLIFSWNADNSAKTNPQNTKVSELVFDNVYWEVHCPTTVITIPPSGATGAKLKFNAVFSNGLYAVEQPNAPVGSLTWGNITNTEWSAHGTNGLSSFQILDGNEIGDNPAGMTLGTMGTQTVDYVWSVRDPTNQLAMGGYDTPSCPPVTPVSASYACLNTDQTVLGTSGSGGITVTLPAASSGVGREISVVKIDNGAGALTIAPAGSDHINGATSNLTIAWQYGNYTLYSDGSSNWYQIVTPNSLAPAVPVYIGGLTAAATAATAAVAAGYSGSGCTITPRVTGRVRVQFSGGCTNQTAASTCSSQIYYYTSSTSNGSSLASWTAVGHPIVIRGPGVGAYGAFTRFAYITGLTVGTPYYFDIGYFTGASADTAQQQNVDFEAWEY